jgi:hypothetical protein
MYGKRQSAPICAGCCAAPVSGRDSLLGIDLRTSILKRWRPTMVAWADFVCGKTSDNLAPFKAASQ